MSELTTDESLTNGSHSAADAFDQLSQPKVVEELCFDTAGESMSLSTVFRLGWLVGLKIG